MLALRFSVQRTSALNGAIKPRLSVAYGRCAPLLSARGFWVVDRAIAKGTVGGDAGMGLLFEPAVLIGLVASEDVSYELASIAAGIPFIGNYGLWAPAEAVIAAAFRTLTVGGDIRAEEVGSWLSLPENGGAPGPLVVHGAMTNRLDGLVVEQIRSDAYVAPVTLPQFSYVMAKVRELSVMWAFGGGPAWPRQRIDDGIAAARDQVVDFFTAR